MGFIVLLVFASALFVEGATELVVKSAIFQPVVRWLSSLHPFVAKLLSCGYCTSVWIAAGPAGAFSWYLSSRWYDAPAFFVFFVVLIQRMSNYLHNFNDKHLDKYYSKEKHLVVELEDVRSNKSAAKDNEQR